MAKSKSSRYKKNMYVVIALDVSASMRPLTKSGQQTYDETVRNLLAEQDSDTNVFVSLITFGSTVKVVNQLTQDANNLTYRFSPNEGSTKIFDGMMEGVKVLQGIKPSKDDAVLFVCITDGDDNASVTHNSVVLKTINEINALDNWTLAFNLPKGAKESFVRRFNIPEQCCREWEISEVGMQETNYASAAAISNYASNFKSGNLRSVSKSFYQNVQIDTDGLSNTIVKKNLNKVTNQYTEYPVNASDNGKQIRTFVEDQGRNYSQGMAYYELTKKEIIQEYKDIIVKDSKNDLYSGKNARNLLGLPETGTLKVKPEDHSAFTIFVQSSSVNRKLIGNTSILVKR